MVPNNACAIPTPHRMKYFHAASRLAAVRYTLTSSTVASVAASMATHRMPMLLVRRARSMAAAKVRKLNPTLRCRATGRCPTSARHPPASSGIPKTSSSTQASVIFEFLKVMNVQTVELLADLEHEHAQDQDAHKHIESDAEFDDHRHAVRRRGSSKKQSVFHRQEADHLRYRLRARDHHHERQQHTGE